MLISCKWLQTYFKEKLPPPEKLAELFTMHFSEVESLDKLGTGGGSDTVFNLKILPDRACYALSHRGVAREVAAVTGTKIREKQPEPLLETTVTPLSVNITEPKLCTGFVGRRMESFSVGPSPEWLRRALESIGQRSINNIVDATNFIMFDIGRPLHAFDADKVKGALVIRRSRQGERITTLDNKEIVLKQGELVIADSEGPLALAGIKGGKRAEVDEKTTNIILEAANWDAATIRRATLSTGVKTDASRRFENRIAPDLAEEGIERVSRLIFDLASTPKTNVGTKFHLSFEKREARGISVSAEFISKKLGVEFSEQAILDILDRLRISSRSVKGIIRSAIPSDRLDLNTAEDLVEEVGRLFGYDKIPAVLPPAPQEKPRVNKVFCYENKIRATLVKGGFSEALTSSFAESGEVAIANPLASDKSYLRARLSDGLRQSLELNARNADLLGLSDIKIFEIGKVFGEDGEHLALAVGIGRAKKGKGKTVNEEIRETREALMRELALDLETLCTVDDTGGLIRFKGTEIGTINRIDGVLELNLDPIISALPEPLSHDTLALEQLPDTAYEPISPYPFIVRDIAVFVPEGVGKGKVSEIIAKEGRPHLARQKLFDEFKKGGKTSYAFRLVFQSHEKTLSDPEVKAVMEKITSVLNKKSDWRVR